MNACCESRVRAPQKMTFGVLAQQVLSLDASIDWVVLEEVGRQHRWAWRNPKSGNLCAGTTTTGCQVVDPLLLMLADHADELSGEETFDNPHRVLFIVLAYADMMQVVASLRPNAHVVVALSPGIDPYALGKSLSASSITRRTRRSCIDVTAPLGLPAAFELVRRRLLNCRHQIAVSHCGVGRPLEDGAAAGTPPDPWAPVAAPPWRQRRDREGAVKKAWRRKAGLFSACNSSIGEIRGDQQ